ncbi:MAG: NAD(P)-dependent glycerol-3-phosphate dehydrogenase [Kiritimatiellae bacterium]|nr:NAD(P)-dependent glycerol-3-phosphate dehydrogenase [Kiritimatiellia bacterium]
MKVAVIGDGGWGTAAAQLLDSYGHQVTVWGPFADYIEEIRSTRENPRYLPGIKYQPTIRWSSVMAEAVADAEAIVLAVPSKFYKSVCGQIAPLVDSEKVLFISLTKGVCPESRRRMSEVAQEVLKTKRVVVLSGPSHAEEVARRIPTAVTCACENHQLAVEAQLLFNGPRFRVYTTDDVLGVEVGGLVKNVLAIAVGVSDGFGFGDNTRAALVTRGLAEMMRLGLAMGAKAQTLSGLAGVGDLIVTCTSTHSRNHSVGERLGRGQSIDEIMASMQMVAEGVDNAKLLRDLALEYDVEMPIAEVVYRMCYENLTAEDAVMMLMERAAKPE